MSWLLSFPLATATGYLCSGRQDAKLGASGLAVRAARSWRNTVSQKGPEFGRRYTSVLLCGILRQVPLLTCAKMKPKKLWAPKISRQAVTPVIFRRHRAHGTIAAMGNYHEARTKPGTVTPDELHRTVRHVVGYLENCRERGAAVERERLDPDIELLRRWLSQQREPRFR